jgi:hypothetical protein
MTSFTKTALAGLVALSTLAATLDTASAHHRRHHRDAWVAGGVGLAAGLIIGGALASPRPVYVAPPPRHIQIRASQAHYHWCASRYRSYQPASNSWVDFHGRIRNCESPYGY